MKVRVKESVMAGKVELKKSGERRMNLKNLTPNVDLTDKMIGIPDINRPALQLTGYFEHFDSTRLQIIGFVEYSYMENMTDERKREIYDEFMSYDVSAVCICRELKPDPILCRPRWYTGFPFFPPGNPLPHLWLRRSDG